MRRSALWSVVVCVLVAGVVALPAPARAWQAFMKITTATGTLEGDVTLKGFEKQINVLGVGFDASRAIGTSAGGFEVGQLINSPLQIAKGFDIATPRLLAAVTAATSFPKVELTIFKTTPTGSAPAFRITLTSARVSQLASTYDAGATPSAQEKLELVYTKLTWLDLLSGVTASTP